MVLMIDDPNTEMQMLTFYDMIKPAQDSSMLDSK